jgi:hypothetical protein
MLKRRTGDSTASLLPKQGRGRLREILEAACEAAGVAQKALTVLSRADPYRLDTDANHRDGRWFAKQLRRFYGPTKKAHWRGVHYSIIMAKVKIRKPDGLIYKNTDEDWEWLSEKAGKAARWLGYIPFDRIIDKRNNAPVIHRAEKIEPQATVLAGLDVELPDDIAPLPSADGFVARQAFSFACFGEKASLEETCLPWAKQHQVDLYLGTGETSDTLIYQIARDAVADGRPLVVFTLTDCDPSGWQMFISIARKLQAVQDLLFPALRWEIVHVGLTPDQVRQFNLAEEPIKKGDKRREAWEQAFGVKQTEIDALTTPEETERGRLRQLLDEAIAPYIDPTLDRRVKRAETKWYREAAAAVDAQTDAREMARLRREFERLQQQIERIDAALHATAEGIDLPQVEVPQSEVTVDTLDDGRQAVITFDTDWVAATKILIARKRYLDDEEE